MTYSAKTLYYFAIYVLFTGLLLVAIPGTFTSLLHLPEIPEGWARILGLLVLVIGVYDYSIAKNELAVLIQLSVYTRLMFACGILLLIVFSQMPMEALPLGLIDAGTAVWTFMALKSESKK